ncbi:MAG: hypothetical protein L0Y70_27305, partial [Gemmataceae bacterium]|nr:hypothetical protein [Gemmataceae bacterium]
MQCAATGILFAKARADAHDGSMRLMGKPLCWLILILTVHAGLLANGAVVHSPAIDEVGHFPAGLGIWREGRFDLYAVNPPLVRAVATLPVHLFADLDIPWGDYRIHPVQRHEFALGRTVIERNAPDIFWWFTVARWACIPFSLLAAVIIYRWANELYSPRPSASERRPSASEPRPSTSEPRPSGSGAAPATTSTSPRPQGEGSGVRGSLAGLLAAALWCFEPMVLGNAQMITPDTGASAFGVFAAWRFWKWLKEPTWTNAFLAGLVLGLAELSKASWIILFALWPLLWIVCRYPSEPRPLGSGAAPGTASPDSPRPEGEGSGVRGWRREVLQLGLVLFTGWYILNLGYAFDGLFTRLGEFRFASAWLRGDAEHLGNRFEGTWLADLPVPLPRYYVTGIDIQKRDFEAGYLSYLRGEWRREGWWYYYLYGLGVKLPVGTLLLILASVVLLFQRRPHDPQRDQSRPHA